MTLAILFWVLYIVALLFNVYRNYPSRSFDYLVWFVLIGILGFAQFGGPVK